MSSEMDKETVKRLAGEICQEIGCSGINPVMCKDHGELKSILGCTIVLQDSIPTAPSLPPGHSAASSSQ